MDIVHKLGVKNGKLKDYAEKTEITDPKIDKVITTILQILLKINRNTSKQEIQD